jgi:hypothetical protein
MVVCAVLSVMVSVRNSLKNREFTGKFIVFGLKQVPIHMVTY